MKVRILGCGTSSGVPRIGNDWGGCDPEDSRNRRTRASIMIETATTRILVDTGPDMREQLLVAGVDSVDAVIWTHDHADHTHGIDDLRQIYHAMRKPVQGYARPGTAKILRDRFAYVFEGLDGYPPTVDLSELPDKLTVGDIEISATDQPHANITSAGLRFDSGTGSIGYATDFNVMTDDMRALYQNLDVWIVDILRRRPHPSHPHLAEALPWIDQLSPCHTALTHLDQSMDYASLLAELPAGVVPAHDGLEFEVER
ncbi:MBL fold metallo-hydrolase [Sphingomonas bacterium]|uniref:MBL fold metallo-hydrolase n=1 Tax=Sphingomonas bacterium TaxID=1895847 RepID=UPI00261DA965|nr:MBL fold metallo-hydrolase [Sphingomonas bacterium]MDB5677175.1 fold metallo-hydrolase [Sphingomonas bacterium]MDB5711063.1 fold metallo-hydrolase [Sphingomonas bacterium]